MLSKIRKFKNFLNKYISFKRVLIGCLLALVVGIYVFYNIWDSFLFPDDYHLTRIEAEKKVETRGSQVIDFDFLLNIHKAKLRGDFSEKRLSDILTKRLKEKLLIKPEDYSSYKEKSLLYRAGTGHVGIWVDERSSLILPSKTSVEFNLTLKEKSLLEMSTLSYGKTKELTVEMLSAVDNQTEKIDIKPYKRKYSYKDVKMKLNNRGFSKARANSGWNFSSIDLNRFKNKKCKIIFKNNGDDEVFIGNPKIYVKKAKRRYNVVYLLFDGVSTRYWSFYNKKSDLTPKMKKAAQKDYIVFDNMFSLGNKTRISTSGLFTSQLPFKTRHGINRNFIPKDEIDLFYDFIQNKKMTTLPDIFRQNGYTSAQFGNSGFTVELVTTGVDYGFEKSYEFQYNPYDSYGISHRLFKFFQKNKDREFFAYAHYNTPHKPFFAPAKYYLKGMLDAPLKGAWRPDFMGAISYNDDVYENIHRALEANGLMDNTIVVVATDHGSGYDLAHFDGGFHTNDYTRLTFMIHLPEALEKRLNIKKNTKRVGNFISSINIAPTLLDLVGLKKNNLFAGKSFAPLLSGEYKKEFFDDSIWCFGRKTASLIKPNGYKYIITGTDARKYVKRDYIFLGDEREKKYELLYDLKNDSDEYHNMVHLKPEILESMRSDFFKADIHHPEKNVLTFVASDGHSHDIKVNVKCKSRLLNSELYDSDVELQKTMLRTKEVGQGYEFKFKLSDKPMALIFEFLDDRAPLEIEIFRDGKLMENRSIYATDLNVNLLKNPLKVSSLKTIRALYMNRLPLQLGWKGYEGDAVSVKVSRLDLHRWMDIKKMWKKGISASMKETLKSWGYIQ